jgi:hypothetical protein
MCAEGSVTSSLTTFAQCSQVCPATLNDALQAVIDARRTPIDTFISQHFAPLIPDVEGSQRATSREQLRNAFAAFERTTNRPQLLAFYATLSEELNLSEAVQKTVIRCCLKRGWIRLPNSLQSIVDVASLEQTLLSQILTILQTYHFRTGRSSQIDALLLQGLCPDAKAGHRLLDELKKVDGRAAGLARGIIASYIEYRDIGLLRACNLLGADELLLLETLSDDIAQLTDRPAIVKAELQTQTLALVHVLAHIDHQPSLLQQDLFHQPSDSLRRDEYRRLITPELQEEVVVGLTSYLGDSAISESLFQDFHGAGWYAMFHRLVGVSLEEFRLQRTLHKHIDALDRGFSQQIETGVTHFRSASQEASVAVPLSHLLNDRPSSKKRLNFGRRIWFGAPAMMKRKQQWRRRHRGIVRPVKKLMLLRDEEELAHALTPENRLANSYSNKAGETIEDTRHIIRSVATSGVLGFFSREDCLSACDPRISEYIELIKFGHIAGAVNFGVLHKQVAVSSAMLGIPPLSAQLVEVLYNFLRKASRWNAGAGSAVDGIVLRQTLIAKARRLNEVWLIIHVTLKLRLIDEAGHLISETCHVLIVIEQATERPIGCWVSATPPTKVELGLAIYQSIWHPWIPDWPIRGIPKHILIPAALARAGLLDVERAAAFLMTTLQVTQNKIWQGPRDQNEVDMVERLRIFGPNHVRRLFHTDRVTCAQAQVGLLQYLRTDEKAFPFHWVAPLDAKLQDVGLGMPGHSTAAAGWLLPEGDAVISVAEGVIFDGALYTNSWLRFQPGQTFRRRAFPYTYPLQTPGFFIEDKGVLQYVWLMR